MCEVKLKLWETDKKIPFIVLKTAKPLDFVMSEIQRRTDTISMIKFLIPLALVFESSSSKGKQPLDTRLRTLQFDTRRI